jgi:hypothetical protein
MGGALSLLFVIAGLMLPAEPAAADPSKSTMGGSGPLANELDSQTRQRVRRGLDWLEKNADYSGGNGSNYSGSIAVQALVGIAFLAEGSTPQQGRYAKSVEKILEQVLAATQDSGLIAKGGDGGPMYGHGFAMLFLAEVYGMSPRPDVKEKLQRAVRLVVQTQNPEGGWQYLPAPLTADTSATICQVMGLRAARNAGIHVPKSTIDNAINYTLKCQNPDGGFRYMLNGGSAQSGWARSAASTVALNYLGRYTGKEIDNARGYLLKCMPGPAQADNGDPGAIAGYMYFYGNYYLCQATFMLGDDLWKTYWPIIREDLAKKQQADGSWTGEVNSSYSTALALIVLQVPNRLLPILQR